VSSISEVRSVSARFGGLGRRYGILLPAAHRYRTRLGVSSAEQLVLHQLVSHYSLRGDWRSFSQAMLAAELGVSRPTVNEHLKHLRTLGFIATRADSRFGTRTPPLFYCLDPYLAVLSMREGFDHFDETLWDEGNERLGRFAAEAEFGRWTWDVDEVTTFRAAHGVSDAANTVAILTAAEFVADEPVSRMNLLSVPLTQEESHIHTYQVPKDLRLQSYVLHEPRDRELQERKSQDHEQRGSGSNPHKHADRLLADESKHKPRPSAFEVARRDPDRFSKP
jgi:hypothetical protein